MSSNPDRLVVLFQKYLAGSCTKQELTEFWALLAELTDEERLSVGLTEAWQREEVDNAEEKNWGQIYRCLQKRMEKQQKAPNVRSMFFRKYRAVAVIVVLVLSGYLIYQVLPHSGFRDNSFLAQQQIFEPVGTDMKVVTLPDGTEVTLRKNSKLYYDAPFLNKKVRMVHLIGEAYFDVAPNKNKPFIVKVDKHEIKVLGTAFNVKSADSQLVVTVTRGKVKVKQSLGSKPSTILTPGGQLQIDNSATEEKGMFQTIVNADSVMEWTRQDLAFNNANWKIAASVISEKYGVAVEFKNNNLNKCYFTGDFTNKSLEDCLDILCTLTNASWSKSGTSTIYIDGLGCQ